MIEYDEMDGRDRSVLVEECEASAQAAAEALGRAVLVEALAKGNDGCETRFNFPISGTMCDEWDCVVSISLQPAGRGSLLNPEP